VYTGRAETSPGANAVEYTISGAQVVHTPALQMLVFDARGTRQKVENAQWDTQAGMPRVRATWQIGPQQPAASVAPAKETSTPATPAGNEPQGPRPLGEIPAWLTLAAGGALALAGVVLVARRALDNTRKGRLTNALLLVFAGAAIVLGALMRLGIIGRL